MTEHLQLIHITGSLDYGYEAVISGVYQPAPSEVIIWTKNILVIKNKGYSYNPGSRYSGLKDYAPTEYEVFEIIERPLRYALRVRHITEIPISAKYRDKVREPKFEESKEQ